MRFPSLLLNHLEPQSSKAKLLLPIMPIGIVAYAFTLLWDNLCRNSPIPNCTRNHLITCTCFGVHVPRKRSFRAPTVRLRRNPLTPGPCFSGQRVVGLQSPTCPFRRNWKHDLFIGLQSLFLMFIALILAFCIGVFSVLLLEAFLLYKWWTLTGKDARKLYPQRTKVTNPEVGSLS